LLLGLLVFSVGFSAGFATLAVIIWKAFDHATCGE
jgi:hypothetical protein